MICPDLAHLEGGDRCLLPRDTCSNAPADHGKVARFSYDSDLDTCQPFAVAAAADGCEVGSGDDRNRFSTLLECSEYVWS